MKGIHIRSLLLVALLVLVSLYAFKRFRDYQVHEKLTQQLRSEVSQIDKIGGFSTAGPQGGIVLDIPAQNVTEGWITENSSSGLLRDAVQINIFGDSDASIVSQIKKQSWFKPEKVKFPKTSRYTNAFE